MSKIIPAPFPTQIEIFNFSTISLLEPVFLVSSDIRRSDFSKKIPGCTSEMILRPEDKAHRSIIMGADDQDSRSGLRVPLAK